MNEKEKLNEAIEILDKLSQRDDCDCEGDCDNGVWVYSICLECQAKKFMKELDEEN